MNIKIGFGYDVHQLKEGRELWLGGVQLEHTKGALGHSDADVLIHAICDAILGAMNIGDIGKHFPDTDVRFKNIDSKVLLEQVVVLMEQQNYSLGNIDCTLSLERPKIAPHILAMQECLSKILHTDISNVSIKATTGEKMGFVGREEGVCAYAVALIAKN
jgi:2-C-methyl-D-erythritol 2,4-cyclodiphosphate synthase